MSENPCDICENSGHGCSQCKRWNIWWRERWAYIHGYAIAHNVQPTTPPIEEVKPIEDESTEEADS